MASGSLLFLPRVSGRRGFGGGRGGCLLFFLWRVRVFMRIEVRFDGYKAPLAMPGLFDHALSIVRTWTADLQELETLLPKLRAIPTLLIWGSKDPAVYSSSLKPLAQHFPNCRAVVFPGVGH